ncbi:hypothetical protein RGQ29_028817 [Quercus rubra]|uniref:Uncharacterized protein n=1 Tax=Quercus rubra TaxID=3512 RepID=A0AAN7ESY1_QUERU|nr:hypothetical protein RGQ29_028817 [Quercus rubra]
MVAQEQYVDPVEENTDFEDPYEGEETLSLCDLPSYSDASNWDDYSKEGQSLSCDSNDFFEFFSEDFTASTCSTTAANKSIIFCGKLIPYKEELPNHPEKPHQNQEKQNHTRKKRVFRWKSLSFNKTRSSSKGSKGKKVYNDKNCSKGSIASALPASKSYAYATSKCDLSVGKVTMLTSRTKSRWYLFMFGMTRFPTEMELRDIKLRQSRKKSPSMMFRSVECDNMVKSNERSRRKGLWRLLKILGSRRQHLNAVVKASFGCILSTRVT